MIEALTTNTSDEALAHGVHRRGADRRLHDANVGTFCKAIEAGAEPCGFVGTYARFARLPAA